MGTTDADAAKARYPALLIAHVALRRVALQPAFGVSGGLGLLGAALGSGDDELVKALRSRLRTRFRAACAALARSSGVRLGSSLISRTVASSFSLCVELKRDVIGGAVSWLDAG